MTSTFEEILHDKGVLVYTNTGNSMWPLLHQQQDLMVIKPCPEGRLRRLDIALYKRDNGQYILHRVLWVRKKDYVMCGDNQYRPELGIGDRHIFGVLDSVVRNGKTVAVRSTSEHPDVPLLYRFYSHLWCDFFVFRAPLVFVIQKIKRLMSRRK